MKSSIILVIIATWTVVVKLSASEFMSVCYYQSWADYRTNEAKFQVKDIDPFLCTHLVFAFAKIDTTTNQLVPFESRDEGENGRFRQFNNLKSRNPALKTLLSVGGETARSATFLNITSSPIRLEAFSSNAVHFLRAWGFDGLDLDWEFPAGDEEKQTFTKLVQVLRSAFNEDTASTKLLLTFAGSAGVWTIDQAYQLREVAKYVDYVFVMCYDYHVAGANLLTFNSPLYAHPTGRFDSTLNTNWSVHYYQEQGMPYSKIVVGFTGVGRRHVLKDTSKTEVGSDTTAEVRTGGLYNIRAGLAYPEICDFLKRLNTTRKFYDAQKNPYCYNGDDWVGYEDRESLSYKIEWMLDLKVAGVMFWALDYDDFSGNHCEEGKYPLLNYVKNMTQRLPSPQTTAAAPQLTTTKPSRPDGPVTLPNVPQVEFQRACYFQSWAIWRTAAAKFGVQDIDANLCTHLIYAFGRLDTNTGQLAAADPSNEEGVNGTFRKFNDLKLKNTALKTLMSIGGTGITSQSVLAVVSSDAVMRNFTSSVVVFLRRHRFDGLDIDWQFPDSASKYLFVLLLKSLRAAFTADATSPKLLLTFAGPAVQSTIDSGYDVPEIVKYVDYVYLLTYDYSKVKANITAFNSPLYSSPDQRFDSRLNINWTVHYWNKMGLPLNKIVVGWTGLGRYFVLKNPNNFGPGADTTSEVRRGRHYNLEGNLAYPEICEFLSNQSARRHFDNTQKSSFLVKGDDWVGYDDEESLGAKIEWMLDLKVAGVVFWALDIDDFSGKMCNHGKYPLLNLVAFKTSHTYTTANPNQTSGGANSRTLRVYSCYVATLLLCVSVELLHS